MGLQSKLFKGDQKLEACLIHDSSHVTQGAVGDHVSKIQTALFALGSLSIDPRELSASLYGKSTAGAVLLFKKKRNIINRRYQTQVDNIVGKMTIAALDKEMLAKERQIPLPPDLRKWAVTTTRSVAYGVSPTKVRKVPQDSCQLPGRKGFSAIPELPRQDLA